MVTGTVYYSRCGPYMTKQGLKEAARLLVGQTMLFIGKETRSGALVSHTEYFASNPRPPEQYERALADLGLDHPSSPIPGLPNPERGKTPVVAFVLGAGAVAGLVLGAIALALRARGRKAANG